MFSLKIVTVDHYQANPIPEIDVSYSDFRGNEIKNVPVIRIFGVTPKGQKACLHIHGIFPYISVPFDGGGDENPESFMQQLCLGIDKALNVARGKNNVHIDHIYKISLISGIPFYGYHEKEQKFFRIFFYNPETRKKAVELLQMGAVMNQIMQPYEAHIPYILQFFIDFNLYGMSTIDVSKIKFRLPLSASVFPEAYNENQISVSKMGTLLSNDTMDASVERMTYCEFEGDSSAGDILNRKANDTLDMNPGLKFIWDEERQRQQIGCEIVKLTPFPSPTRDCAELTESESFYKKRLRMIIDKIPQFKDSSEEVHHPEDSFANGCEGFTKCSPAGTIEIHNSLSQGKEVSKMLKPNLNSKSLTQELHKDKQLMQSQNSSMYEDKEFLDMIISMIDNQNCSPTIDMESTVINEQSVKYLEQNNYTDAEDELEMSLCVWDDVSIGSDIISLQDAAIMFPTRYLESKVPNNKSSNVYNKQENAVKCTNDKNMLEIDIDSFIIPQIDGVHDTTSRSNAAVNRVEYSRREQLPYNVTTSSSNCTSSSEAQWIQTAYTSNVSDQYNFHYGAYTSYNQPTYSLHSSDQHNTLSATDNESASASSFTNVYTRELFHSQNNSGIIRSVESNMDICIPSCTVLSTVSTTSLTNTAINEIAEPCKPSSSKCTQLTSPSHIFPGQFISKSIKDQSFYKAENVGKFQTIDANVLKEDISKTMTPHKNSVYASNTSTDLRIKIAFNDVKKLEVNNVGTQIYPCRVGGLLPAKTKVKSVCNTSTQTNAISKSFLHHGEKVNEERKSNPRTLVVQRMKRLKLSLSKNRCNQRMGYFNDKHIETNYFKKCNAHRQENSSVVESLATNLKPYPFIHRHAPELIQKKKKETENTVVLPSVLSHHIAKGIILPPYVTSSDLNKIGNEKVVLKRLESDINNVSKSKVSNYTVHCINNRIKKADHLPVLTVKFKMSEINAWKKAHKSDAQTELTKSQSVLHQIKRCKKRRNNDITIQKGTVDRYEEKVISENSSFATSKIAFEHTDKILSTSHTNDDFMTKANEEIKSVPRAAKHSAVSKLSKNYLNNVKDDSCNGTQSSAFNLNTTKKETNFKNATYSSPSKLCKKHKDKLHSASQNSTDIVPTNLSVTKTGRKTNSKCEEWSDFPKLPESDGSGMLPLNKHNNIKSTSILEINDGKKQNITNRMNNFVITKLAKQNNKVEKNSDNDTWDLVVGRFENEAKSINARCNVAKLSKKSAAQLSSLNQIVDKRCITHKLSSNSAKKEIDSLKTVPLKLTIKLPSLIRHPRVKKRKRRSNCGLQAFQPSSCWKSLILPQEKSSTLAKNSETRPKRPNVDYKAHAYTHLLEFDKMIELPCDKIKNSRCGVKNISELGKRCKNLEIRLERLKPEFLESINLQQKSYILHKEMKLLHNSKEKNTMLGKEGIYQCLNVYPISVDTNAYSQTHNIDSENNDYIDDNLDVMWNLSYLSPSSEERALLSPPQCWSPYNNNCDESSRESISEQIAENGCFHETAHSMVISLEEKKHNSDEELLQSESNSVKCLSPTLSNTFSVHDSEVPEKSLVLPELNPDNAISYTNSPEFNVEKVDKVSQHSRYIQNTHCKSVVNAEIQNIEKDCNNTLPNLAHSPVLTLSQEKFSVPECSQDSKEDFNKVLHTDYDFNRFNLSKNVAQRADDQSKPEENSSTENDTYQKLDHQNYGNCDTLLHLNYKAKPVHKNTIYQKTNISKNYNNECKLTASPITDKINPINEEGASCNFAILSSTSNLYLKKQDDCHSDLCDSKTLNSTVQNSEVGSNLSKKENVKSISSVKNVVAPNVSALLQRNAEINLKIISESKFSEEKSNLSSSHNEEIISNEFEKVDGNDQNSIQQNNTNNIFKENNQLICIQVDNCDECKLNYDETEQLHSKNVHKNVASSLHTTNAHILNSNLSENSRTPQDCCNERQIKECNNLLQDTCNTFNCTKDINDVELLQSGKNAFHNTASSNILINDDIYHKESKEKQAKLSEESVCTSSNLTNKHCDSIKTDTVLDTKSITKTYLPTGVEDRNSNTKLLNNGLATSDQLDNVKDSCCIKLHKTQTDQVKNSELNVFAETCDSQPLSPEEKVIYDSQGNILSSNTSSQYSLCMGNHASQDEVSFENCSKILNIGNDINKSNLIESFDLTNKIQKTAECISNYVSVDKNHPEQQVIQETTIYKSILNLSEDILQMEDKSSKQPDKAEVSKDMDCLAMENEHFKEENCSQLCNESCLVHNNPLETKCHSKSAVLLGPFKEVSFVFNSHSQLNSEQCADETSILSPNLTGPDVLLEENKLMTHIHQVTSNQTEIINVSCGLSSDKSKNAVTPVKLFHSEYCKSVVPPVCTKSVLQKCSTHDLAVNTIKSKDTYHTDGKFSDLSNNENFSDITQTDVINEPCTSNKGETTINYLEHDKIHNAYNSNIVGLSVTDLSGQTLVDDQHKEKKSSCLNKNNCHDNLVSLTKNYIEDLEKPTKLSSDDSSNLENSVEDDISDITNTCLNKTSCVSQIDNNNDNDDLNEVPCKLHTDETTSKNSGIYSFYADNTISKVVNTTMCSDKSQVQLFCQVNETNLQVFKRKVFFPLKKPPTSSEILATFAAHGIPQVRYQSAYYGISSESPKPISEPCGYFQENVTLKISELLGFDGMFQHIGLEKWQSEVGKHLKIESSPFSSFSMMDAIRNNLDLKIALAKNNSVILTPAKCPPGRNEIKQLCSGEIPSQSFKQEENIEKISSQLEYINNPETEITVDSKEEKYGLNTSMSLKQKHAFIFEETSSSNYQHSTPLTKQRTQCRKKRSNSWSESETDKFPQLLKRRRLSGDHISCSLQFNHKSEIRFSDFSPICSPLVIEMNEKIQNKKRRLPLESEKLQSNKFNVSSISTPIKRMPSVRKTLLPNKTNHEPLTLMSLEIHAATRKNLRPDPKYDPIKAIFYCINDFTEVSSTPKEVLGIIIVNDQKPLTQETFLDESEQNLCKTDLSRNLLLRTGIIDKNAIFVKDEESLLKKVITIVRKWNPDIICGYEISMLSWGFLIQRAAYLNLNLYVLLSRVSAENYYLKDNYLSTEKDYNGIGNIAEMQITGRIVLNVWRLMRKEVTLNIYTFENVAYHVLHQRVPYYSFCSLTQWFSDSTNLHRWRVIDFYNTRVKGTLQLLHRLDLINRTSTLARIFGIQFYEVLSRGTQHDCSNLLDAGLLNVLAELDCSVVQQPKDENSRARNFNTTFRVESMMLRSAKPLNYVPVSPSIQQRSSAKAPECFPLIMEPESKFYTDPVLVLDFQSLYPSIIIAYNYCYSTCLGRVSGLGQNTAFEFGCASLTVPTLLLKMLENDINVSSNGVAYVQHHIRLGVLPQMLQDILNTRIMVKKAMKEYKDDEALYKLLDGRQLALKLIANVTYGYTGASYSGRMPCVEVADSIVGKARETLERAIKLVERTAEWDAKVVYGDTDSMFVLLKGRSKEQAFKIGHEIAEAVTAINPKPVKLKFEKVYLPCLLQTKKRYVGFMYETPDQLQPIYDAKGIETVRRDSCPVVAKILENSLKLLFTSKNISLIKKYVQKQFQKLLSGQADIQDCIFAREYRGMSNYRANACVPALEIARRMIHLDPRAEPRVGERVPYIIVYGFPGLPLIQLVRQPHELLGDPSLKINAKYYINRVIIPPLHRVFSLIGVNVSSWYTDIPWTSDTRSRVAPLERNRGTLSQYLAILNCPICNDVTDQGICNACKKNPQHVILFLNSSIRKWERKFHHLSQICNFCTGAKYKKSDCISLDCPVLFKLHQASRDISEASYFQQLQQSLDF